jgi:hypothetical protein
LLKKILKNAAACIGQFSCFPRQNEILWDDRKEDCKDRSHTFMPEAEERVGRRERMTGKPPSETLMGVGDIDFLQELSEYLDVLSNSVRLRILKLIEKKPKDARTISHEIETSYENTKKHLDKLLSIGLIRKEAGIGKPTSKGVHPVWEYSLVPGALEAVTRNLALFSNTPITSDNRVLSEKVSEVKGKFRDEFGTTPALLVMGGTDDGTIFHLQSPVTPLGRRDPSAPAAEPGAVVLSEEYRAVTRVSHPHARIVELRGEYYLEDRGSTGGTWVNGKKVLERERVLLHDGALIDLAKGPQSVTLLCVLPEKPPQESSG